MQISEPGFYPAISEADYHEDPCPEPSLTQSLCKTLLAKSPRHAWFEHPRLNPNYQPDDATKFDVGNVAHQMILGRGRDIAIIDAGDWRTKAAQNEREIALANGKMPVLTKHFNQCAEMVEAAHRQLDKHEDSDAFTGGGQAEVMICWQEDGIWFRSLIDWLHDDCRTIDDFKTSKMSMAPHTLGRRAWDAGWHIQAAFHERGLNVLDKKNTGRRRHRFIGQEADSPYALSVMHMDEHWLTMGRKMVNTAVEMWKTAIQTGRWSGYTSRAIVPQIPGWAEKDYLERELSGEFEAVDSLMGG